MPKFAKDATEFQSRMNSRKRSDGKLRYETSIPVQVAEHKGKWIADISEDNIITWNRVE